MCVESCSLGARFCPPGSKCFEASANSHAFAENLASDGGRLVVQRILDSEFETVDGQLVSEIVVKLFLRDSGLRYTKTAERARGHQVSMHGAGQRAVVRNMVGPRSVNRHARRNRWPPGGISSGIEIGGEVHCG